MFCRLTIGELLHTVDRQRDHCTAPLRSIKSFFSPLSVCYSDWQWPAEAAGVGYSRVASFLLIMEIIKYFPYMPCLHTVTNSSLQWMHLISFSLWIARVNQIPLLQLCWVVIIKQQPSDDAVINVWTVSTNCRTLSTLSNPDLDPDERHAKTPWNANSVLHSDAELTRPLMRLSLKTTSPSKEMLLLHTWWPARQCPLAGCRPVHRECGWFQGTVVLQTPDTATGRSSPETVLHDGPPSASPEEQTENRWAPSCPYLVTLSPQG